MRSWLAECPHVADNVEVIVVDDGSRDRTGEMPSASPPKTRTSRSCDIR